eukprot:8189184-Pyramimonas_sp.AAC.1
MRAAGRMQLLGEASGDVAPENGPGAGVVAPENGPGTRDFLAVLDGSCPPVKSDLVRPLGGVGIGKRGVANGYLVAWLKSDVGPESGGVQATFAAKGRRPARSCRVVSPWAWEPTSAGRHPRGAA